MALLNSFFDLNEEWDDLGDIRDDANSDNRNSVAPSNVDDSPLNATGNPCVDDNELPESSAVNNIVSKAIRIFEGNEDTDPINEPTVGMAFESAEEFAAFCYIYAFKVGFELFNRTNIIKAEWKTKGISRRCGGDREPEFHMMSRLRLVCKKGGSPRTKGSNVTGCPVAFDGRLDKDDVFIIRTCHVTHNHDCTPEHSRRMVSFRAINSYFRKKMLVNDAAGIPVVKNFNSLVVECGGYGNLTFNKRDARNVINLERRVSMIHGDAATLESHFVGLKLMYPDYFYAIQKDADGRLLNVFWADPRCRAMAKLFDDAVSFDTTFLCNRYDMPFAPFVGVNHHGSSIVLAAALISHEDADSFIWVFEQWISCMGRPPGVILSDQCRAIGKAINTVFPNTPHRLCLWHMLKNATKSLGAHRYFRKIEVDLLSVVHESLDKGEFEAAWVAFVDEYGLHDNPWVADAFHIRERWVPAYWRHVFCAGMSSTQRSEQMNRFFKTFMTPQTGLMQFVSQFNMALEAKVEEEQNLNFVCINRPPKYDKSVFACDVFGKVYTNRKFEEFMVEVAGLTHSNAVVVGVNGCCTKYSVSEKIVTPIWIKQRKSYEVCIDTGLGEYACSCKLFEFRGIICRHIIRCVEFADLKFIPEKYILSRWRKDVYRAYEDVRVGYYDPDKSVRVKRAREVAVRSDVISSLALMSEEAYAVYERGVTDLRKQLEDCVGIQNIKTGGAEDGTLRVWCRRRVQPKDLNMRHVTRNGPTAEAGRLLDPVNRRGAGRASRPKHKPKKKRDVVCSQATTSSISGVPVFHVDLNR